MIRWPKPLSGRSSISNWLNELRRAAIAHSVISGPNILTVETPSGTYCRAKGETKTTTSKSAVTRMRVMSVENDFLYCLEDSYYENWNFETQEIQWTPETSIRVARPAELRASAQSAMEPGNNQRRRVAVGTDQFGQGITPAYAAYNYATQVYGTVFFAAEVGTDLIIESEDERVQWIDLNVDARRWEFDMHVLDVCFNGVRTKALGYVSAKI